MDYAKITELFENCTLQELHQLDKLLQDQIVKKEVNFSLWNDEEGRKNRREDRFDTSIPGTLHRLTDVKPGELKEYSVTINDLSRRGMCMRVIPSFIPSRLVKVTFAGQGGKIKKCELKLVRMRKVVDQENQWLEIGCESIRDEEIQLMLKQEERIVRMRNKLRKKKEILVIVVGPNNEEIQKLMSRIKIQEYRVHHIETPENALGMARQLAARLVLFMCGERLLADEKMVADLMANEGNAATMAIVPSEMERVKLFRTGIDECLTEEKVEKFLFYAIERALVGHAARRGMKQDQTRRALVVSEDNMRINLIAFALDENGYRCRAEKDAAAAQALTKEMYDLVFADYDPDRVEEFKALQKCFPNRPVVALCGDIAVGKQAVVDGARHYLCMPPSGDDIRMVLESAGLTLQPVG